MTAPVDIAPEVVERMVALVRAMAVVRGPPWSRHSLNPFGEAKAIVALLPEPIDPDVLEAGSICTGMNERGYFFANAEQACAIALAGIKRGRKLERQS